jgi:negative regulator of replication initiation
MIEGCWEALGPPLSVVPQLPADTTLFLFLLKTRAVLSSFRRAGEGCRVEIVFIKANSSCLSMMLRRGNCKKGRKVPVTPPFVASNTGLENQYLLSVEST